MEHYIDSVRKLFLYYKSLGEKAMEQVEPAQLFYAANENTNSIAVIVKHLSGNMLSRWTDFLTTDGEKEWRNRDGEFEENPELVDAIQAKAGLLATWEKGWQCLFAALDSLKSEQLDDIVYIRNEGHTVMEAINRQLAHYPYHVGQMIFYAKLIKNGEWDSLSIPKNKSGNYNADKFSKDKSIGQFTDSEQKRLDDNDGR
jgi:hypothetical protein